MKTEKTVKVIRKSKPKEKAKPEVVETTSTEKPLGHEPVETTKPVETAKVVKPSSDAHEGELKKPELKGESKTKYPQPGTNNQKTVIHE